MLMFKIKKFFLTRRFNTPEKRKLPEYKLSFLELEKKYNLKNDYEYELETNRILNEPKGEEAVKLGDLDVMVKYKKITGVEYCKEKNDILHKPWIAIKTSYDEESNPDNLELEVEYNKTFVEHAKKRGFSGETTEDIVDQWISAFFLNNVDKDMLQDIDEENESLEDSKQTFKKVKLNNNSTFIG